MKKNLLKTSLFYLTCLTGSLPLYGLDTPTRMQIERLVKSNPGQLSLSEYTYLAEVIEGCSPCNILIFGLGNDSFLWDRLNREGNTVFLEQNLEWYEKISMKNPNLTSYFIQYWTKLRDWKGLLGQDPKNLLLNLPPELTNTKWDLIFVDAPEGYNDAKPGRMQSIYTASVLGAKGGAHVLVHDCNRAAEAAYCDRFLMSNNLVKSIEKIRHYQFKTN
jgi:glucuronoxylan 4-O-methyltransferase